MRVSLSLPFPGVSRVLEEGALLGLWQHLAIEGGPLTIPVADTYIIGAWHQHYEKLLHVLPSQARKIVLWTSSAGEIGLEPVEQGLLYQVLQEPRIQKVWVADMALLALDTKVFYAPYPYNVPRATAYGLSPPYMTMFSPGTLKKNHFPQFLAAAMLQQALRAEGSFETFPLYTNVEVPLVFQTLLQYSKFEWLPQAQYRDIMQNSRLNWACSWAETLSFQAAEAAAYGVPSVCSRTIPWAPEGCQVTNPNDPHEITQVARRILGHGAAFRAAIESWSAKANQEVQHAFEREAPDPT